MKAHIAVVPHSKSGCVPTNLTSVEKYMFGFTSVQNNEFLLIFSIIQFMYQSVIIKVMPYGFISL